MDELPKVIAITKEELYAIGTGAGAVFAFVWKYLIIPRQKWKNDVNAAMKTVGEHEKQFDGVESNMTKLEFDNQLRLKELEARIMREIDKLQKSQDDAEDIASLNIQNLEKKNEKLLDLIIKYFSEKND